METLTETPRQTRIRLNKMERWCQKNAAALGPAGVKLRGLFELAHKPQHADYLEAELREVVARTPQPEASLLATHSAPQS